MSSADAVHGESNIEKTSALDIHDAEGKEVNFGSLFADKKVVVVFIRTYFCGVPEQVSRDQGSGTSPTFRERI
ncbi:hypothetical protein K435DRAFT_863085 [Dendrothele bispora CBS 962.96]|uniref:Uncharacterized protein n=1 Tax=Dendrothele bispora (strain CBS 962.96) TaxID=1314807 RepID=A0A4S8LQW4_DENBC|nr:hypothetical protein K435DRAFT_863085 [Dendrothele bispora CBS 962.96]